MKTQLALLTFLSVLLGTALIPVAARAEHPLVTSAHEMQAELQRLGFTSEKELIRDFLEWRRMRYKKRQGINTQL